MSFLYRFLSRNKRVLIVASILLSAAAALPAIMLRSQLDRSGVLEERRLVQMIFGLGTIEANQVFQLRLGINARIERLRVREGDQIEPGRILVEFDNIPAIRSPIAGVVTGIHYRAGETAFAGNSVLIVTNLKEVAIQAGLEERAAVRVRPGQKVRLRFDALGDRRFESKVTSIYPGEGQFLVRIAAPDPLPKGLLPGMTADVAIETHTEPGLVAPTAALPAGSAPELSVEREGRRIRVPVTVLARTPEGVAVAAIEGQSELHAGDIVRWRPDR